MRLDLITASLLFVSIDSCTQFLSCELCAGQTFLNKKCRWCLGTNSCHGSKYECKSNWYTLTVANCPNAAGPPTAYNDNFVRREVTFYSLAMTRWNNSNELTIEGDTQQCLDRIRPGIRIWNGFRVNAFAGREPTTAVVFVDETAQSIWVCFRGTIPGIAFWSQGVLMGLRATKTVLLANSYPLKLNKYYGQLYEVFCNAGLCSSLEQAASTYPSFRFYTCGHSLGGTMADIFSLHIAARFQRPVYDYSMAGPRAGGEDYALLHSRLVNNTFRVIREGDWVPDLPFRNSELQFTSYHPSYEVFYDSQMDADKYQICPQPDGDYCNRGHWLRKLTSHLYMFDQSFQTWSVGPCLE